MPRVKINPEIKAQILDTGNPPPPIRGTNNVFRTPGFIPTGRIAHAKSIGIMMRDNMRPGSGNPVYHEYVPDMAESFCCLGMTEEEIYTWFGIDDETWRAWKHKYPELAGAIFRGKEISDGAVTIALRDRALGYTVKAEKFFVVKDEIRRIEYIQHYPPDPGSCRHWLASRQRGRGWAANNQEEAAPQLNIVIRGGLPEK